MNAGTDTPGLDRAAVIGWLVDHVGIEGDVTLRRITGGQSNLTFEVRDATRRLILRRAPLGDTLRGAHDVVREYRILEALQATVVPVPVTIGVCEDPHVTGAPFTVVQHVAGLTLRSPDDLASLSPAGRHVLTSNVAHALADLHRVAPDRCGLPTTKGEQYVARQLHVWRRQLEAEPRRALPAVDELGDRLGAELPNQERVSIVHGDYRLDNVLVDREGRVLAIVDWELWTLGDPLADLGAAVAYWTDSPFELAPLGSAPTQRGDLGTRADLVSAYASASGQAVDDRLLDWYVAFGLWRFAAIIEGVYRRHLVGAYGEQVEGGDWRRYAHVVPVLAETGLAVLAHTGR